MVERGLRSCRECSWAPRPPNKQAFDRTLSRRCPFAKSVRVNVQLNEAGPRQRASAVQDVSTPSRDLWGKWCFATTRRAPRGGSARRASSVGGSVPETRSAKNAGEGDASTVGEHRRQHEPLDQAIRFGTGGGVEVRHEVSGGVGPGRERPPGANVIRTMAPTKQRGQRRRSTPVSARRISWKSRGEDGAQGASGAAAGRPPRRRRAMASLVETWLGAIRP
jgi:hypothetical protein